MPKQRTKRFRFFDLLASGLEPSEAAKKAKIRHRQTAYRYRQDWLQAQKPVLQPPVPLGPTREEMEPFWHYSRHHGTHQPTHSFDSWKAAGSPKPLPSPPQTPSPRPPPGLCLYQSGLRTFRGDRPGDRTPPRRRQCGDRVIHFRES